jgi:hypothetical protein
VGHERSCVVLLAWLLIGCRTDIEGFAERVTTPAERQFAADYLRVVQSQSIDSAYDLLVPELQTGEGRAQLVAVAALLAAHPPDSLILIGVQSNSTVGGVRTVNLSWEYRSGTRWFATNVAARYPSHEPFRAGGAVYGFHVQPLDRSLRELNRFTLSNRSAAHCVWLVGVIALPIFCLGTALRLATARGLPKRWLWAVFALVGVSPLLLDWTTGHVTVRVLAVNLFAAGATKGGPAAPWILGVAFPLGAVLGLARYRRWRREARSADPDPAGSGPRT